ncbi:MAG: NAD-binding oxidoreductase, partial [Lachnospiraceae bacterium]|nr:NAD-binding oxidoreductase [Lachnospiraceae bacterium]
MYQILKAEELTTNIFLMVVKAPRVAKSCLPGQFVIVRTNKDSERIPLTICDYDRTEGTITIVFQIVGAGTKFMSELKEGDSFADFV